MFRYGLVVAAVLGAAGPALSATWADALFDEFSKDFGSVPRGPMLTHNFRIANNTRGVVNIASVRVSCGCVTATALKGRLEPGESTHLEARMDTTRFTGLRSVTIYVQFDQPAFEEVRLWVQANGRKKHDLITQEQHTHCQHNKPYHQDIEQGAEKNGCALFIS